ncbi:unnamed protein product [Prunus armeniaca]
MNVTNRGDKRSRILKIPRNGSPCRKVLLLKLQNAYIKCFTCISDAHRQRAIVEAVGPTMEKISGPNRYLALYFASAIASSAMSYWFSEAPAVGASGAVFGLVGSLAVFVMRHRGLVGRGKEDLQHIAHVITVNMAMGFFFKGIDNWGHLHLNSESHGKAQSLIFVPMIEFLDYLFSAYFLPHQRKEEILDFFIPMEAYCLP